MCCYVINLLFILGLLSNGMQQTMQQFFEELSF